MKAAAGWVVAGLASLAPWLLLSPAWAVGAAEPARVGPPSELACPRDQLTLYAGRVLHYARSPGRTELRIATDWDTVETVTLLHPGSDDPSRWFLIARQPFAPADWARIELRTGELRPGVRAAAWVCNDGRNATLDWTPPPAR